MKTVVDRGSTARRRLTLLAAGAVMALLSIGCANSEHSTPARPVVNQIPTPAILFGTGTLAVPSATGKAITYDQNLAPVGAPVTSILAVTPLPNGSTRALLAVFGLLPNRGYAAHAHTNACGAAPGAAGPHFQHMVDPNQPSVNNMFANPSNEIWLDVRTNAVGAGTSRTTVPFVFTDRVPGSIVIHAAEKTETRNSVAGTAGPRIACLTLSGS